MRMHSEEVQFRLGLLMLFGSVAVAIWLTW